MTNKAAAASASLQSSISNLSLDDKSNKRRDLFEYATPIPNLLLINEEIIKNDDIEEGSKNINSIRSN